jgi:CHASE2 domain-containing sensor protein
MHLPPERRTWWGGWGLALLLLGLTVVWMDPLDNKAFDVSSRLLRHREGNREVVLVGLDEATEQAYRNWGSN